MKQPRFVAGRGISVDDGISSGRESRLVTSCRSSYRPGARWRNRYRGNTRYVLRATLTAVGFRFYLQRVSNKKPISDTQKGFA